MDAKGWQAVLGGDARGYMTEQDVGTDRDPPQPWVIVAESMNVAQARTAGIVLAAHGVHVRFLVGTLADNLAAFARWKYEQEQGGD